MFLYKFECGCIGLAITPDQTIRDRVVLTIRDCRGDGKIELRESKHLQDKSGEKLSSRDARALFAELRALISQGHALDNLQDAFRMARLSGPWVRLGGE